MAGTLNNIYRNVNYSLDIHTRAMAKLQEQAYTGSRVNRVSDDASAANRIMGLNSQKRSLGNYIEILSGAQDIQQSASIVIEDMVSFISDIKVNLTQMASGTYGQGLTGQNARERLATEINSTLEYVVSSANTKHLDQYIFASGDPSTAPYAVQRSNGQIASVTYQGPASGGEVEVTPGLNTKVFYAGNNVFGSSDRSEPVFSGGTGAVVGTGTSNVTGDTWLTVTNDGTNYKLSIDDGATEITVPTSGDVSNIAVTDSTGGVLYVDATNLNSTGDEMVSVSGTYDIFNALINLRNLLNNDRGLSETEVIDLVSKSEISLDEINNHLVQQQVSIGMKMGFLDTLKDNLENVKFNAEDESSMLQEADIAQIATDLSRREVLYQMSLSVAGRVMSVSLLDFIR
ncbi:MAG: flagellar hook-associated protein FlgL [Anaerohalosphaeraceae bacterium]|nr:flagellar hook-associated protein FlgL [Anaerohalosphaeraceae bacterium]